MACVGARPIKTALVNHWMYVAAKRQASQGPGAPVIVPNDPPDFAHCVAQVRKQIPALAKTPTSVIRPDCKVLFTSLSSQVMNFLIRAYWYEADAALLHIRVSAALVERITRERFPTRQALNKTLKRTGQTVADLSFGIRVQLTHQRLLKSGYGGNPAALNQTLIAAFAPTTYCRASYSVTDCGHMVRTA